jgi:hypothetical protein
LYGSLVLALELLLKRQSFALPNLTLQGPNRVSELAAFASSKGRALLPGLRRRRPLGPSRTRRLVRLLLRLRQMLAAPLVRMAIPRLGGVEVLLDVLDDGAEP